MNYEINATNTGIQQVTTTSSQLDSGGGGGGFLSLSAKPNSPLFAGSQQKVNSSKFSNSSSNYNSSLINISKKVSYLCNHTEWIYIYIDA